MQIVTYSADQVWGLAVRADTINEGYSKEGEGHFDEQTNQFVQTKKPNKHMVKQWLRDDVQPNEAEIVKGREYRAFFNTYTMKALMGGLSDFDKQALKIAQMEEFTGRNMLEFAIVSCLPSTARREQARTELKREVFASTQLSARVGDEIVGDIEVVSSRYNVNYDKHKIVARMGESFVDFWFSKDFKPGDRARIKGKVKQLRGDLTTQLNYVKIRG